MSVCRFKTRFGKPLEAFEQGYVTLCSDFKKIEVLVALEIRVNFQSLEFQYPHLGFNWVVMTLNVIHNKGGYQVAGGVAVQRHAPVQRVSQVVHEALRVFSIPVVWV